MRVVKHFDIPGTSVQDVLAEFNERRTGEFKITDGDLISISVRDADKPAHAHAPDADEQFAVVVTFFYWGIERQPSRKGSYRLERF
jgi:hypothetical protein